MAKRKVVDSPRGLRPIVTRVSVLGPTHLLWRMFHSLRVHELLLGTRELTIANSL